MGSQIRGKILFITCAESLCVSRVFSFQDVENLVFQHVVQSARLIAHPFLEIQNQSNCEKRVSKLCTLTKFPRVFVEPREHV